MLYSLFTLTPHRHIFLLCIYFCHYYYFFMSVTLLLIDYIISLYFLPLFDTSLHFLSSTLHKHIEKPRTRATRRKHKEKIKTLLQRWQHWQQQKTGEGYKKMGNSSIFLVFFFVIRFSSSLLCFRFLLLLVLGFRFLFLCVLVFDFSPSVSWFTSIPVSLYIFSFSVLVSVFFSVSISFFSSSVSYFPSSVPLFSISRLLCLGLRLFLSRFTFSLLLSWFSSFSLSWVPSSLPLSLGFRLLFLCLGFRFLLPNWSVWLGFVVSCDGRKLDFKISLVLFLYSFFQVSFRPFRYKSTFDSFVIHYAIPSF